MTYITILESYILPFIYFALYTGGIFVLLLIILRIKQLSHYQHRIIKTLNPEINSADSPFMHSFKHMADQMYFVVHRLLISSKLLKIDDEAVLANRLDLTGYKSKHLVTKFMLSKGVVGFIVVIMLVILNQYFLSPKFGFNQPFLLFLIGLLLGLRLSESYLERVIQEYRRQVQRALPDALDLMVICLEAGYSNEHALDKIASEFALVFPELSNEFSITANELKILPDRKIAWKNFATRTDISEANAIMSAFSQNDKYGTSIVTALRTQVELFRNNKILRAEEKAAKIPVLLAIPLSLFFLPILFVIILSQAFLKVTEMF